VENAESIIQSKQSMNQCVFCGHVAELVYVHGHYQCPVCKTNAMPCCDSDNCDTNALLKNNEGFKLQSRKLSGSNPKLIYPDRSSGSNNH
jgi:hypothetical protein